MATAPSGGSGASGGPNPSQGKDKPFSVEQAERDLREAKQKLNELKRAKLDTKAAEEAVKKAQNWVDRLTKGSAEDRRKANRDFMKKYFEKIPDWAERLYEEFPDLRSLLERAMAGNWNEQRLRDELQDSSWFKDKKKTASWLRAVKLEYGNPKGYEEAVRNLRDVIAEEADKFGVTLTDDQYAKIARAYIYGGWAQSPNELNSYMARMFRKQSGQYEDPEFSVGGTVAENVTKLKNLARDMGLTFDEKWFRQNAAKITEARQNFSIDDARDLLISAAREKYGLSETDIGFVGNGQDPRAYRSLRALVADAITAGGETARRLLEDSRIQALLTGWESTGGRSLAELWNEFLSSAKVTLRGEARRLGLNLDDATLDQLSREYQYRNWDDNPSAMRQYLAGLVEEPGGPGEDDGGGDDAGGDGGGGGGDDDTETTVPGTPVWDTGDQAALERQLRSWARNYGVDLGNEWFKSWVDKIVLDPEGGWTKDDALNEIIKFSRQTYGVFSEEINDGVTVRDLAGGYIQRMARLLEIDASEVDLSDPLMQRALTARTEDGKPTLMSLYDFASAVRQDDRWQATDNALDSYASTANEILKRMGFVA